MTAAGIQGNTQCPSRWVEVERFETFERVASRNVPISILEDDSATGMSVQTSRVIGRKTPERRLQDD